MKKLSLDFYLQKDAVDIARQLLGKIIVTEIEGQFTSGYIVETEAYVGITDKASHSFNGRRTARNEHMYFHGGTAYVYICYGMHQMLNIVTNDVDIPDAILIRAIQPLKGIELMAIRTGKQNHDSTITRGPGNVAKALGISKVHSGESLMGSRIYIGEDGMDLITQSGIGISKRIGVESSGEDGLLPYRFFVKGNKFVSGRPTK